MTRSLFIGISLFAAIVVLTRYVWTKESKKRTNFINISISFFIFFCFMFSVESYFKYFFNQSDTFGHTLASHNWFSKNWQKKNSLKYRDVEHPESRLKSKKVVFVVGDSFVAGHGIKDWNDRFAAVLQKELGVEWEIIIIAGNGWDTVHEYNAIISYPHKPDVVVLAYYINDILHASEEHGMKAPKLKTTNSKFWDDIINTSYTINFIYWRLYRLTSEPNGFWEFLVNSYSDKNVWETHKKELLDIVNYAKKENVGLVSMVFPHLMNVKRSDILTSKVVNLMKNNNVVTIDLGKKLKLAQRDLSEILINNVDSHASIKLNREIGHLLVKYVRDSYDAKHSIAH